MKKRKLILTFSICAVLILAALIAVIFIFRRETTKYSFDKLKLDYISDVAYNDTYIVGKDGGFYLWRDGKIIGEKYSSITSVNDFYGQDISTVLCSKEANQKIYDLYIAKKSDADEYFLINSAEEKYTVTGSDYSLSEVVMPLLVFTNASNGCKAIVNIDALNSGLSSFSDGYIYPTEFNSGVEIFTKPFDSSSNLQVCDYVIAKQESDGLLRSLVFSSMGKLIVSTNELEFINLYDDDRQKSVFFCDRSAGNIYSRSGELIASDVQDIQNDVTILENCAVVLSQAENKSTYTCFNAGKKMTVSSDNYDFSTLGFADGCIYIKDTRQGVYNILSVFLDEVKKYDRVIDKDGYLLARDQSSAHYVYLNERGEFLFEYAHDDLVFDEQLSCRDVCVFEEVFEHGGSGRQLIFSMPTKQYHKIVLYDGSSIEKAELGAGNDYSEYGIFIKKSVLESGEEYLSLYTPFEKTSWGEKYDKIDIFRTNGIMFGLGTSFMGGYYDIIDLPSNSVIQRIECKGEDFAKLSLEIIDQRQLLYDSQNGNGAFPIIVLSIKKNINESSDAGSRRLLALYRNATYGNKGFDYAKLNAFELGDAIVDDVLGSFDAQRYFSVREASAETVFAVNEEYTLVRVATVYGRIKDIIADCSDPNKKYIISENEAGYLGLYDFEENQMLSHYYNDIRFVDGDKIGASRNGAYGIIRYIDGKLSQMFDFKYADMRYFGEGTILLKEASGNSLVYRNSKLALDEDVLGGKTLINYVEGQHGYEMRAVIILFAGDKLYIDEIEGAAPVELESFSFEKGSGQTKLNARAKLIYYYKQNELVGKDVVYPTVYFEDHFLNNDSYVFDVKEEGNWYYEADFDLVGLALSKDDVFALSENFITLYYHEK